VRTTVGLLTATACLRCLAVGTLAANAGSTPVELTDGVRPKR